ncbi:hypothetical protein V2K50_11225 [Pseudomonas alliivorans]|nr:hypothetical protein [Pseudomonas alliivorans]
MIREKACGVHYASAQFACHQINHALAQPATTKLDERLVEAIAFVQKLRDAAAGQPSFATGCLSGILDVLQGRAKLNAPQ